MIPVLTVILSIFLTAEGEATPIAELPQSLCGEVLLYTTLDATCSFEIEGSPRPKKNPFYEN